MTPMKHICKTLLLLCAGMLLLSSCDNNNEWKQDSPKNKIKGVISYRRSFGDLNKVHLSSAKKIGISPIDNREDIDKKEEKLMYIGENPYYSVDKLTHSIPYLVPKASALLMTTLPFIVPDVCKAALAIIVAAAIHKHQFQPTRTHLSIRPTSTAPHST